jgi:hypothetical protein
VGGLLGEHSRDAFAAPRMSPFLADCVAKLFLVLERRTFSWIGCIRKILIQKFSPSDIKSNAIALRRSDKYGKRLDELLFPDALEDYEDDKEIKRLAKE